ncbi:MAG: S41 family peptidase [Kangiellaceae bacterium]|nr:S41 family peptidase [Kangiellaceae bacterium]MCW8997340.1 S41 family peptidase [Kangiellaceae bacterium]
MKKLFRSSVLALIGFGALAGANCFANSKVIDQSVKKNTVERVGELMKAHYVFPEVGEKTARTLSRRLEAGDFDDISDTGKFAKALTEAVQEITKDKHLRLRLNRSGGRHHTKEDSINERIDRKEHSRETNLGIKQVRKLDGNVGYLDLQGFFPFEHAKTAIDSAMSLLETSDAIIIDLRRNGGGDPATVQYLCSYFFEKRLLLNSLYWREGDVTNEFWTLDEVNGTKLGDIPLFILTSSRTFSAAEEFSYNMQSRKRATLIGETTGGGANPGRGFRLNEYFGMFIATGKAINPITGTNWEGVGVIPEIKVAKDAAFDKAVEMATDAAEGKRKVARNSYKSGMVAFNQLLEQTQQKMKGTNIQEAETTFFNSMRDIRQKLSLNEGQINELGYEYLIQKKQPALGLLLMKYNAKIYPESANVYDSLGDAWLAANNPKEAKKSFAKGLELVGETNENLRQAIVRNLAKAEKLINNNK